MNMTINEFTAVYIETSKHGSVVILVLGVPISHFRFHESIMLLVFCIVFEWCFRVWELGAEVVIYWTKFGTQSRGAITGSRLLFRWVKWCILLNSTDGSFTLLLALQGYLPIMTIRRLIVRIVRSLSSRVIVVTGTIKLVSILWSPSTGLIVARLVAILLQRGVLSHFLRRFLSVVPVVLRVVLIILVSHISVLWSFFALN